MTSQRIRPLALAVFRKSDSIFISKGYDSVKNETFYRPIGGGIEFGEQAAEAIAREVREEISAEIKNVEFLGLLENIFTFNGRPGHELIQLFEAEFVDADFYREVERSVIENGKVVTTATWVPLQKFRSGEATMYPTGILELLNVCSNLS